MRFESGKQSTVKPFIFDLDGTLVDSFLQIETCMNKARLQYGFLPITQGVLFNLLGQPIEDLIADLNLKGMEVDAFIRTFRSFLREEIERVNILFPGVLNFLQSCEQSNIPLGIATSKPTEIAVLVVNNSRMADFDLTVQGTEGFPSKPNPEVIKRCLDRMGFKSGIMFGDRIEDVEAAIRAGILAIGVAQSAHSVEQLKDSGAIRSYKSFIEVMSNFDEILQL